MSTDGDTLRLRGIAATGAAAGPLDVLQRLRRPAPKPRPGERCEMCAVDIGDEHSHLVRMESRSLLCTCRPCYLLFAAGGAAGGRYKTVPDRYLSLPGFDLTRTVWEDFQIPVSVAFFFHNSAEDRVVAFYPSPAGATECLLKLEAWQQLVDANPAVPSLESDVEALLVRVNLAGRGRGASGDPSGDGRPECFIVPIDACYELVGHIRLLWRGFDGGQEAHEVMDAFFDRVRARSRPAP